MSKTKTDLPSNNNVLAVSGLNAKSITSVNAYFHGSVGVVELGYSGGTSYIKFKQQQIEVGGTNEWGTGTIS